MKTLLIIITFLLAVACSNSSSQDKKVERIKRQYKTAEANLSDQKEKIALLSRIKHISYDSLYLILREYIVLSSDPVDTPDYEHFNYTNAIDTVSKKMNISKSRIASLIFSFKYELRTTDEIIEEAQDDAEYENEMDI